MVSFLKIHNVLLKEAMHGVKIVGDDGLQMVSSFRRVMMNVMMNVG